MGFKSKPLPAPFYTGQLKFEVSRKGSYSSPDLSTTKNVYGDTIGELLDNMVEATESFSEEANELVKEHILDKKPYQPVRYFLSFHHPDVLGEDEFEFKIISGPFVQKLFERTEEMPLLASTYRYDVISETLTTLNWARNRMKLTYFPNYGTVMLDPRSQPANIWSHKTITGVMLDKFLDVARKDGTLKEHFIEVKENANRKEAPNAITCP